MLFYFLMLDLDIPYVDFLAIYNLMSLFNFFSISSFSVFFGFASLIDGVFCLLGVLKNGRCGAIVLFTGSCCLFGGSTGFVCSK